MLVSSFLAGRTDAAGFTFTLGILATLTALLKEFTQVTDNTLYWNIGFDNYRVFMEQDSAPPSGHGAKAASVRRPPRVELRDVPPERSTPSFSIFWVRLVSSPLERALTASRSPGRGLREALRGAELLVQG